VVAIVQKRNMQLCRREICTALLDGKRKEEREKNHTVDDSGGYDDNGDGEEDGRFL